MTECTKRALNNSLRLEIEFYTDDLDQDLWIGKNIPFMKFTLKLFAIHGFNSLSFNALHKK